MRDLGRGRASRQGVWGAGSCRGGRRFAPTALRCSPGGGAAELATCPFGSLRSNSCGKSDHEARVFARARPQAVLLVAPEVVHAPDPLPRSDVVLVRRMKTPSAQTLAYPSIGFSVLACGPFPIRFALSETGATSPAGAPVGGRWCA